MPLPRLASLPGCLLALGVLQVARTADQLSTERRMAIDRGEQLFVQEKVEGASWPRARVYQYAGATPEEAAAVWWDFERQASYIPNLKRSRVARVVDRRTVDVEQVLGIPVFADERYTVRNTIGVPDSGGIYRVDWTLVRASSTKATVGGVRFEPYRNEQVGAEGTLVVYENFVTPGSRLAGIGFVKRRGLSQMRETVAAFVKQLAAERTRDPELLQRQLAALRAALAP